jgi:transposase-like protein
MTARKKQDPPSTHRAFSAEFKLEAVQRADERRAAGGRLPSDEAELRRLEREVRRLSQENAFLKTAAAYFAKESR